MSTWIRSGLPSRSLSSCVCTQASPRTQVDESAEKTLCDRPLEKVGVAHPGAALATAGAAPAAAGAVSATAGVVRTPSPSTVVAAARIATFLIKKASLTGFDDVRTPTRV